MFCCLKTAGGRFGRYMLRHVSHTTHGSKVIPAYPFRTIGMVESPAKGQGKLRWQRVVQPPTTQRNPGGGGSGKGKSKGKGRAFVPRDQPHTLDDEWVDVAAALDDCAYPVAKSSRGQISRLAATFAAAFSADPEQYFVSSSAHKARVF